MREKLMKEFHIYEQKQKEEEAIKKEEEKKKDLEKSAMTDAK